MDFNKFGKKIYIAKRTGLEYDDYGNQKPLYDEPIEYKINVQPTKADSEMENYGMNATQVQKGIFNRKKYSGMFNEYDLAYLDGATPEGEAYNGQNANYRIKSVREQNLLIAIYFEKIVKEGNI